MSGSRTPGPPEPESGVGVIPDEPAAPSQAMPVSPVAPMAPGVGPGVGREALYFALRNKKLLGGLTIVLLFLVAAVIGPRLLGGNPNAYVGPPFHRPDADPPRRSTGRRTAVRAGRDCS